MKTNPQQPLFIENRSNNMSEVGMSAIQEREIRKAIKQLEVAGAKFAVLLPTGEKVGNLDLAKPKLVKPEPKYRHKYTWKHLQLSEYFKGAKQGDVLIFPIPTHDDPQYGTKMHSRICGEANHLLGKGNYTSLLNREMGQVEMLVRAVASAA